MGLSFSCPFASYIDFDTCLASISLEDGRVKSFVRCISFKSQDLEQSVMPSIDSQKMRVDESVGFKVNRSIHAKKTEMLTESPKLEALDTGSPNHEAAIKLQKVYKSFRTRRKLADCAVQIEQSWWKVLDFEELKRSSISFFDIDKHETAISRWSRARTRAAKVGKGLSKNGKAQKLALQHWLEAIDPRHRYGHNLHFYFLKWLQSQSREPFFYWLDIGEGKEVNLVEKCSRSKLQQQCIKYLGPMERKAYEVVIEDGKLLYKQSGEFIDTTGHPKGAKWIFVLSTSRTLYVGIKNKGSFQHSSFLAGGATLAAGRIVAEKGILKVIWPHSGHYRPTQENFQDFVSFLQENDVDTTYIKMDPNDDDKESFCKQSSCLHIRIHSLDEDMSEKERLETDERDVVKGQTSEKVNPTKRQHTCLLSESPKKPRLFGRRLSSLEIPNKDDFFLKLKTENQATESTSEAMSDDEEDEPNMEEKVPKESLLQRINSHKETVSFQLGKQLSCKWSTGAGPRIGCLRDYPTQLQSHTLEQASLSPRNDQSFENRCLLLRNNRTCRTQSSPLNTSLSRTSDFTELFD